MCAQSQRCPSRIREALTGPCPSIRTPFTPDGEIDFEDLRSQIDFVIDAGAKVVILTAGDSLFTVLTDEEVGQLTKAVVEHVSGRAVVVAATGQWWTGRSAEFAQCCKELGADVLMVLPPDWSASTTVETLVAHYAAAAEHMPVMVVTNYLGRRSPAFAIDVIQALYNRVPGIVAVKDDVTGEFARKLCLMTHERWAIISGGKKENHMNMLPYGVDGFFSIHISFKPEIAWRYWQAVQDGSMDVARTVIRDYDIPLFDYVRAVEGGYDAAFHGILEIFGVMKRYRRPPYHTLSDEQMQELSAFLRDGGWL